MKPEGMAHSVNLSIDLRVTLKLLISKERFADWIKQHAATFSRPYIQAKHI
jgi:hypothetical protein